MYSVSQEYSKKDIYRLLNVPPESQKGSWDTGYRSYNGDIYIFTNIGVAGRTGINHGNYWENDKLVWFGKSTSHMQQNLIKKMVSNKENVHIFFRNDSTKKFIYKGLGKAVSFSGNKPVKITWTFINPDKKPSEQIEALDGLDEIYSLFKEGTPFEKEVLLYKRSLEARNKCILQNGCICCVCKFDFEKIYGSIGKGFIHIHHLKQLAKIDKEYVVDPKTDLVPVCPNCHSMLHKEIPPLTIEQLKSLLKSKNV